MSLKFLSHTSPNRTTNFNVSNTPDVCTHTSFSVNCHIDHIFIQHPHIQIKSRSSDQRYKCPLLVSTQNSLHSSIRVASRLFVFLNKHKIRRDKILFLLNLILFVSHQATGTINLSMQTTDQDPDDTQLHFSKVKPYCEIANSITFTSCIENIHRLACYNVIVLRRPSKINTLQTPLHAFLT